DPPPPRPEKPGSPDEGSGTGMAKALDEGHLDSRTFRTHADVKLGSPTIPGTYNEALWSNGIASLTNAFRDCLLQQDLKLGKLSGSATAKLELADGVVKRVTIEGVSAELAACITSPLARIVFTETKMSGNVSYPVSYTSD